ncbi:MAG: PKD domain-containing protein [Deltaproteobacteria bacterium]|nr:PKD domain-containing protein [Deltaproteobacteria bacterium]
MKKGKILTTFLMATIFAMLAGEVIATEVIDQQFTTCTDDFLCYGGSNTSITTDDEIIAMPFHSIRNNITKLEIYVKKVNTPTDGLNISIRDNTFNGAIVRATTISASSISTSYSWITWDFTDFENDGGTYYIRITTNSWVGNGYYEWGYGAKSGSTIYWYNPSTHEWVSSNDNSTCFRLYAEALELTAQYTYSISGYNVTFTDESVDDIGTIVNWTWDFGDGSTSYLQNPTHTYSGGGNYTVTLTVTNDTDDIASISKVISISGSTGGGWVNWKLPLSWFSMFVIGMIGLIGVAMAAFFLKPESIKHVGYAPAAGTMLITVFLIAAILMYHAGIAWYWIAGVVLLIFFILYVTVKVVTIKKKKLVKSVLGRRKVKRRRR